MHSHLRAWLFIFEEYHSRTDRNICQLQRLKTCGYKTQEFHYVYQPLTKPQEYVRVAREPDNRYFLFFYYFIPFHEKRHTRFSWLQACSEHHTSTDLSSRLQLPGGLQKFSLLSNFSSGVWNRNLDETSSDGHVLCVRLLTELGFIKLYKKIKFSWNIVYLFVLKMYRTNDKFEAEKNFNFNYFKV